MNTELEPLEDRRSPQYLPSRSLIADMPERVGMSTEDVETAFRTTSTLDQARDFVSMYLQGVVSSIDEEQSGDAPSLTKRHLIDLIWIYSPSNGKTDHPSHRPSYLIVEAMEEILPSEEFIPDVEIGTIHQVFPQDLKYREIARRVREQKKFEQETKAKLA